MNILSILTRLIVLVLYGAVFIYAFSAIVQSTRFWVRRAMVIIIAIVSLYWTLFYTHLIVVQFDVVLTANTIALWSRVGHIATAVGLWTIVAFVRILDQDGYAIAPIGGDERDRH